MRREETRRHDAGWRKPRVAYFPKTWLLYEGWRMYGLLAFDEVPSAPKVVGAGAPRELMA